MAMPAWKQRQIEIEEQRREEQAMARMANLFGCDVSSLLAEDAETLVECRDCKAFIPVKDFPIQNRQVAIWRCATCEAAK